jgi:RHS repeat-associated protein
LTGATVPDNSLTYSFAAAGNCGVATAGNDPAAGDDGNRTGSSDTVTGGSGASTTPVVVGSCYDDADRLTSDSVTGAPAGASPILATNLVSTPGPSQNLGYDAHGDSTSIADQSMTYDQTGRHLSTTTSDAGDGGVTDTVAYLRDVTGNAIQMSTTIGGTTTTVDYSGGGGIGYTFTGSSTTAPTGLQETDLSLPGGVTLSLQGATGQVWSYPDLHGDDTVTTNGSGTRTGVIAVYDPFGDPINLATGLIGTLTANTSTLSNTTTAGTSYGWEGSHGKQDQTTGDIATIEMGARQYVPLLGRFLSVDPVVGGNANDYNYPNDPTNGNDLSGTTANCARIDGISCNKAVVAQLEKSQAAAAQKVALARQVYFGARFTGNVLLSAVAVVVGNVAGDDCNFGRDSITVCGSMPGMKPGDGLTVGNVVFAGSSSKSALGNYAFMKYETTHSSQWATLGPLGFGAVWMDGWMGSICDDRKRLERWRRMSKRAGTTSWRIQRFRIPKLRMEVTRRSIPVAIALAICMTLALAGCENFARGPLAVKRSGSHLLIAICTSVEATSVFGEYRQPATSSKYTSFLDGKGRLNLQRGQTISTNLPLAGFKMRSEDDPEMGPGVEMDINVGTSPASDGVSGGFTFGTKGLTSSKWLHPDGSETVSSCSN